MKANQRIKQLEDMVKKLETITEILVKKTVPVTILHDIEQRLKTLESVQPPKST